MSSPPDRTGTNIKFEDRWTRRFEAAVGNVQRAYQPDPSNAWTPVQMAQRVADAQSAQRQADAAEKQAEDALALARLNYDRILQGK